MNEENMKDMTEEQTESFMKEHPTRGEVNQYLNNLFIAVNNSIGVFHATNMAALASVLATQLSERGASVTSEDLLKMITEESIKLVREAQANMQQAANNVPASEDSAESPTAKEVDISVF